MKILLKIIATLAGLVVIVAAVAAIVVPRYFDPNDYKDYIVAEVEKRTGQKFSINGDIVLSLFPGLRVELDGMSLGSGVESELKPQLETGRVHIQVKLLPLLRKQLQLDKVALRDAVIYLETGKTITGDIDLLGAVTYDLAGRRFEPQPFILEAVLKSAALPEGAANIKLTADLAIDLTANQGELSKLTLAGFGIVVTGDLGISQLTTAPSFSGTLRTAPFSPRELLRRLGSEPPEMADPEALARATLAIRFTGSRSTIDLRDIVADIDDTRIKGNLAMTEFSAANPRFDLSIDRIDADRYLPPRTENSPGIPPLPEAALMAAAGLPLELLRGLDAGGQLAIGRLQTSNVKLDKLTLTMDAKDGAIRLHPVQATFYQGAYRADIHLDATGQQPKLSSDVSLRHMRIEPFLRDLMDQTRLAGTMDLSARLSATGAHPEIMKSTLTGEARFSILDGSYNNDNLAQILGQAASFLPTQPLKTAQQQGGVTFSELGGTVTIDNGLISNQDLSGKSSLALVHGAGTINLMENTIDYGIEASLTKAAIDPDSSALTAAQDYTLPIHIHGPLNNFALQADFSDLAGAQIKRELEKRNIKLGEKLEKQLREKLNNEAGDLLKHFLKF